jgi:hypothetical protein
VSKYDWVLFLHVTGAFLLLGGATLAAVYEEVVRERTAELPSLLPELTFELLVPFVGEEAARVQERRAAAIG